MFKTWIILILVILLASILTGCLLAVDGGQTSTLTPTSGLPIETPDSTNTIEASPTIGDTPPIESTEIKLTPTSLSVEQTSTAEPEFVTGSLGLFWHLFDIGFGYAFFPFNGQGFDSDYVIDDLNSGQADEDGKSRGPGDALYLRIANTADLMAFWTLGSPGELWISNLTNTDSKLIFSDAQGAYPKEYGYYPGPLIDLQWTPDDLHLIVSVSSDPALNMIYHVEDHGLEPWPYSCNYVVISPRSNNLSLWCEGLGQVGDAAVIEWGGEIWHSDQPAPNLYISKSPENHVAWKWSPSGERIAYFDTQDGTGVFRIADRTGKLLTEIPDLLGYWTETVSGAAIEPPSPPILWAADENRIVVFAIHTQQNACPDLYLPFEDQWYERVPCWMVLDVGSEIVVWTVSESLIQMFPDEVPLLDISPNLFFSPAISPDGRFLVINSWVLARRMCLLEIDSGNLIQGYDFILEESRWGIVP